LDGETDDGVVPLPPLSGVSVAVETPVRDGAAGWHRRPCRVPILMYHRLTLGPGGHPRSLIAERFRAQLAMLRELRFRSVRPGEIAQAVRCGMSLPSRRVAITLDDGYLDTLTIGLPLLRQFGFTATCYLVADRVGRTSDWTIPAPLMGWGEVREWLAAGMAVGSHSLSHRDLRALPPSELRAEVGDSKARIEDRLGIPVESFAYPFNRFGRRELDAVELAGYRDGCAGVDLSDSLFALTRVSADYGSLGWFRILLVPVYPELRRVYLMVTARDRVRWWSAGQDDSSARRPDR